MKILKVSLIVLSVFFITACGTEISTQVEVEGKGENSVNTTINIQENIEIRGIKKASTGTINAVSATLENKNAETMTFEAILYFKDKENKIIAENSVLVENLEAGAKKSISIQIMGSYEELSTYELVIVKK